MKGKKNWSKRFVELDPDELKITKASKNTVKAAWSKNPPQKRD